MDWMTKEILTGLQKLLCLSLDRTPALDSIEGTLAAWMEALTFGRAWDEQRDTPRIRQAFSTLMQNSDRWPSPSQFNDCLPRIVNNLDALPRIILTDEQRKANLDRLAEMAKDVLQ